MTRKRSKAPTTVERLEAIVDRFTALRVVVVGDVILDEYLWGDAERVSPEAPVPVGRTERTPWAPGGAANVASNLAELGVDCALCGVVGEDEAGLLEAALIANAAASVAVGKIGTAAARRDELRAALPEALAAGLEHT